MWWRRKSFMVRYQGIGWHGCKGVYLYWGHRNGRGNINALHKAFQYCSREQTKLYPAWAAALIGSGNLA